MINLDTLLDSTPFWIGVFIFFVVLGRVFVILSTSEDQPKKKGK